MFDYFLTFDKINWNQIRRRINKSITQYKRFEKGLQTHMTTFSFQPLALLIILIHFFDAYFWVQNAMRIFRNDTVTQLRS